MDLDIDIAVTKRKWYWRIPYYTLFIATVYIIMYTQIQYPSNAFFSLALDTNYAKQTC